MVNPCQRCGLDFDELKGNTKKFCQNCLKMNRLDRRNKPEVKAREKEYRERLEVKIMDKLYHQKYHQRPEVKARLKAKRQTPEYKQRYKIYAKRYRRSDKGKIMSAKASSKYYKKKKIEKLQSHVNDQNPI